MFPQKCRIFWKVRFGSHIRRKINSWPLFATSSDVVNGTICQYIHDVFKCSHVLATWFNSLQVYFKYRWIGLDYHVCSWKAQSCCSDILDRSILCWKLWYISNLNIAANVDQIWWTSAECCTKSSNPSEEVAIAVQDCNCKQCSFSLLNVNSVDDCSNKARLSCWRKVNSWRHFFRFKITKACVNRAAK